MTKPRRILTMKPGFHFYISL